MEKASLLHQVHPVETKKQNPITFEQVKPKNEQFLDFLDGERSAPKSVEAIVNRCARFSMNEGGSLVPPAIVVKDQSRQLPSEFPQGLPGNVIGGIASGLDLN